MEALPLLLTVLIPMTQPKPVYIEPTHKIQYNIENLSTVQPVKQGDFAPLPSLIEPPVVPGMHQISTKKPEERLSGVIRYSIQTEVPPYYKKMHHAPVMPSSSPSIQNPEQTLVRMTPPRATIATELAEPLQAIVVNVTESKTPLTEVVSPQTEVITVTSGIALDTPEPSFEDFSGCDVKGNISSGKRQYYTTECSSYSRVKIDETQGETMFCSIEEAESAGFQLAPSCLD